MAMISVCPAILEVKNITAIKTNKGKSSAMICGMKPI
jgi:hypothetical protein